MIKNIRRGNKTPSKIYRIINGVQQEINRIYTIKNGEPVIVWDTSSDEYLKIYESAVGQKFVERTYSQYIYPDVYWVHMVDGVQTETYLSSYLLNSFECSTLTAQVSSTIIDGQTVEYVSNYVIDSNAKFGEHHLKVTYKSPDTGNILTAEYSIYYLQEVGFDIGGVIEWYPFRSFLTTENLGSAKLNFACVADNGKQITETYSQLRNTSNISYEFPEVANADFKFGDGQNVGYTYVSPYSQREYTGVSVWNIRPYYHSDNSTMYYGYTVKSLKFTEITINSDVEYYSSIYTPSEYTDNEDYCRQTLENSVKSSTDNLFYSPKIATTFSDHSVNVYYYVDSYPASTGYIYWGDGTFSYYAAGEQLQSSTSKLDLTQIAYVKIMNGYKLVDGVKTAQYITPYKATQEHTYTESGEYTVIITSAYPSDVYNTTTCSELWYTWPQAPKAVIRGGDVNAYTPYKDLVLSASPASSQVQKIKIGDGCFIGAYRRISGNYYYASRGYYGAYNPDNTDGILAPFPNSSSTANFVNLAVLELPKMSASCTPIAQSAIASGFFTNCKSLKDICYNGTKADFETIFGEFGSYIDDDEHKFLVGIGDNATFRNDTYGLTYSLIVHCSDDDIIVTVK